MALPQQVQAALDAADATLAASNTASTEGAFAEAPTDGPVGAEPLQQESQHAEAPAPAAVKPTPEWESRYRTLQGVFNKEVPALQQQVKVLQGDLNEAIDRLNRASSEKEQTQQAPTAADTKDVENFGEDLVGMVTRIAHAAVVKAAAVFDEKTARLEQTVGRLVEHAKGTSEHVAQTEEQAFWERLAKLVPQWEAINDDQNFKDWLAEVDPVYGVPRQKALDSAQKNLDAQRVASVFAAFTGPIKPAPKKVDPLANQVSPKSSGAPAPSEQNTGTISQAQVTAFYNEVRQGKYRGNEAESQRIEALINTALAEGRVR